MDSSLSLDIHTSNICKTCLFYLYWISKIRRYLTLEAAKTLVQAHVISRLDYCNAILINIPKFMIERMQKIMNIAARIILQIPRDSSVTNAFIKLHWLKVNERNQFKVLCITWKALHGMTPAYISNRLKLYTPSRNLQSENSYNLCVPRSRTRFGDRAFSQAAPQLWNSLPIDIRKQTTFPAFKRHLKTYLFKNMIK